MNTSQASDALRRVVFESVTPEVDGGRYPAKRIEGDTVVVEADIFADGHDQITARLLWKRDGQSEWRETPMQPLGNDRWRGSFPVAEIGRYRYTLLAFVDPFRTWRHNLEKRVAAGQDVAVELLVGAALVREAAAEAESAGSPLLRERAEALAAPGEIAARVALALDPALAALMDGAAPHDRATRYHRELAIVVEPRRARFSAWYELFPRSCADQPGRHGTFRDVEKRLPYIAEMGFDILYLPPIHPIGRTFRKGPNNTLNPSPDDPGSPWAIGAAEGGHTAVHPQLGTLEDFRHLVEAARRQGIEIALDIALQASPDHPDVQRHPEWFRKRPDGSIQYAENPPKKYQDIYPFDFESPAPTPLWDALKGIFDHWIEQGVRVFRVDNPHTKPFAFWEWCLGSIRGRHPDVLFLSEAFTRPRVMYRLAKLGFSQSYTYFPWRQESREITQYLTEITRAPVRDFFRPNHWTNTPDILTAYLQYGGRPAFAVRLILAATLGASYGIYGPAFELLEHRALREGSEEYLDSEKYQLRHWDLDRPDSLRPLIARVNRIRRENPALQSDWTLRFHPIDNNRLLCYSKITEDRSNAVLVVVNLDPHHTQSGWIGAPPGELGAGEEEPFQVHDLISDARYLWHGDRHYVELDPQAMPAQIFRIRRRLRRENDFEYYL